MSYLQDLKQDIQGYIQDARNDYEHFNQEGAEYGYTQEDKNIGMSQAKYQEETLKDVLNCLNEIIK